MPGFAWIAVIPLDLLEEEIDDATRRLRALDEAILGQEAAMRDTATEAQHNRLGYLKQCYATADRELRQLQRLKRGGLPFLETRG